LTATAGLMLVALIPTVLGIFLDNRMVWLKPAKFAISSAIYAATLVWMFRYIRVWPRFVNAMGRTVAGVLVLEVVIIYVQAARGTTSHFNVATVIDGILFGVMGTSIVVLWLASVGVLVALLKQSFPNAAWGWSLRLGLFISLLGSDAGGLMLRPTPEQESELRAGRISPVGGHTGGAPDGGNGLPGVGWSTQHGDLRIPHFFGMHAFQIVPALGWLLTRRRRSKQVEIVFATAASYLTLPAILMWQALRGQPLIHPGGATLLALGVWFASTALAFLFLRDTETDDRVVATPR